MKVPVQYVILISLLFLFATNGQCESDRVIHAFRVLTNQPPVAANDTIIMCENGGTVVCNVQKHDSDPNGDGMTTSIYSGPKNGIASLNGNSINYTPTANFSGKDTIVYVVCDDASPSMCDTALVLITVNPSPVANPGLPQTVCYGDTISIGSPPVIGYTYSWTPDRGLGSYSVSAPLASPDDTTTYTLLVTNLVTGCQATDSLTIKVKPVPAAHILPEDTLGFCQGDSVTLTSSNGATFLWSNGDTSKSIVVAEIGNYSVGITYANGCTSYSAPAVVSMNPLPIADAGHDQTICNGATVTLGTSPVPGETYSWSPSTGLSSTSVPQPLADPSTTTTYVVTATFPLTGCQKSASVTITVNPAPAANAGANQTMCQGSGVSIGAAPVSGDTYSWSPAAGLSSTSVSEPLASPDTTTTYVLTETISATGCQKSDSVIVTVNPLPAADTGPNQTICQGSGVSIGAAPASGDTYSWSPSTGLSSTSVSEPIASPVGTTTYTLTETISATGCQKSNSVSVTVNPTPAADTGPNQTLCQGSGTSIGAAPVSGDTYSWSPSAGLSSVSVSEPTASPITTTTYTLTETVSATGCQKSDSVTVTVNTSPAANAGSDQTICNGSAVSIGTAPVAGDTYSWLPSTGLSSASVSEPMASPVSTTTYTLTETISATGCQKSNSVIVTVNSLPAANTGPNQTICNGSSVSIGAASVSGDTYNWSPAAGLSSTSVSAPTASPDTTTTYTLTETVSATGCLKTDSVTITVNINSAPAVNAGSNQIICNGSSVSIGAAPVSDEIYSWWPAAGLSSTSVSEPTASPATTTTYILTETNSLTGCQKSDSVTITVNPSPAATTGANQALCKGSMVSIGAAPVSGDTYSWSPSTGLSSTSVSEPTAGPDTTTTYILTETILATGCQKSNSVTVTVNPLPAANTGPNQTICKGSGVTIGATPVSGDTYSWSPAAGLSSTSVSEPLASPDTTTTYLLTETISATGCQKSDSITIAVNPSPAANAGSNQTICQGSGVSIGETSVFGDTYSWSPSAGLSSASVSEPIASPDTTTTYVLTETISATGCQKSNSVTVTVNPLPVANTGANQSMCKGAIVSIGAAAVSGDTYSWSPSSGLSSSSVSEPTASPDSTTIYVLTETVSATGCRKSDSVTVTVNPYPVANPGAGTTICNGSSTSIGAAPVTGYTYSWSPSTGLSSASVSQPTADPAATTTYTLTVTSTGGCSNSGTVTIAVNPSPLAYTGPDQIINPGTSVAIGGAALRGNTYSWSPAKGLSSASVSEPTASPDSTITYTLTETDTSTGCSKTNSVRVTVIQITATASNLFYNAISPNGDGINDTWDIPLLYDYPENKVLILNRWGDEVWVGINYDSKTVVWSGQNMQGENLPDGTYYYTISYDSQTKQGWVFIKR